MLKIATVEHLVKKRIPGGVRKAGGCMRQSVPGSCRGHAADRSQNAGKKEGLGFASKPLIFYW